MMYNGTVIVPVGSVFSIKVVLRFILVFLVLPLGSFGAGGGVVTGFTTTILLTYIEDIAALC